MFVSNGTKVLSGLGHIEMVETSEAGHTDFFMMIYRKAFPNV